MMFSGSRGSKDLTGEDQREWKSKKRKEKGKEEEDKEEEEEEENKEEEEEMRKRRRGGGERRGRFQYTELQTAWLSMTEGESDLTVPADG